MITKDYIKDLKTKDNEGLNRLIEEQRDSYSTVFVLENLGHLPANFNGDCLVPLLQSKNERVRFLAVKNIGKLGNDRYLDVVSPIVKEEKDSMIRREAVSTIGRMHSRKAIPILKEVLNDPDPKVVLQGIRALLVFKEDISVRTSLVMLLTHPNEMIQEVIKKEFFTDNITPQNAGKHAESPDYMKNAIVHGDVREILKSVPDGSIHLTFTSPPYYNARDCFNY